MTNAAVIPEPGPFSYRLTFEHSGQEGAPHMDPMDVHGAWDANDRTVLDAVLTVARRRWPGAVLEVRVNRKNMRGRILAGATPARRSVVEFTLAELGDDADPLPATVLAPRPRLYEVFDVIPQPSDLPTDLDGDAAGER